MVVFEVGDSVIIFKLLYRKADFGLIKIFKFVCYYSKILLRPWLLILALVCTWCSKRRLCGIPWHVRAPLRDLWPNVDNIVWTKLEEETRPSITFVLKAFDSSVWQSKNEKKKRIKVLHSAICVLYNLSQSVLATLKSRTLFSTIFRACFRESVWNYIFYLALMSRVRCYVV